MAWHQLLATTLLVTTLPFLPRSAVAEETPAKRPHILWIVSEDNSVYLGCYGCRDAKTPHLDQLASDGLLFENAFAAAPVCAPSRCSIITAMYAPSLGTQHMRSSNLVSSDTFPLFVKYLRKAGYYCTNNSKTDYNLRPVQKDAWHEITGGDHHRRAADQPFFAVYNLGTTHESSLHKPIDESLAKADVELPPYHRDTPEIRANWAMYHQIVTRMDAEAGKILRRLETDGDADDTIVFYYADHGGILPRSKRFLYDTGVHVPLIVRFGKNFQHLDARKAGSRTDELISLIDLGPTVLSLAGVEVPKHFQGQARLGAQATSPREYVYCFRGRMDDRYDFSRAVRDKQFKYIRNYYPHRAYGQHLEYLWKMPATRSWENAHAAGKCNEIQSRFWGAKPAEELYDTRSDRWEVKNLADDPAHADTLARLRAANHAHLLAIHDSEFLPEAMMVQRGEAAGSIAQFVRDPKQYALSEILEAAETASLGDLQNVDQLIAMLADDEPAVRYWGATGLCILGAKAEPARKSLLKLARDDAWPNVRIAAAEALAPLGEGEAALKVLTTELRSKDATVALHAANVLEVLGEQARPALPALRAASQSKNNYVMRATEYTVMKLEAASSP